MTITAQYGTAVYGDSKYGLLVLNCSGGSYTITGGNASFLYNQAIQGNAGAYTLTGGAASFLLNQVINGGTGNYTLTGQNAGLINDQVLNGGAGSYTLTGSDATLDYDQILRAEAGSFTLTGNDCTFLYDQTIYAGAFSFIWSGQQAGLIKANKLYAQTGAYTLTGQNAGVYRNRIVTGNAGSYTFTGNDAELVYSAGPTPVFVESKGGIGKKKKTKLDKERQQREELESIVKKEFDILDGTYQPEVVETIKEVVLPQIKQIDYTEYAIALAQVNALLLQAKIQAAEYQSEIDDEEAILMLL